MIKHSVKRPLTIFVVVIVIIVLGVVAFTKMSTDLMPSFNLPYIMVVTTYVGAAPEQVEAEVTKPIEDGMAGLTNLKNITSTSFENYSMVSLEFEQQANLDTIAIDVSANLNRLSGEWDDKIGSPIMIKMNPNMLPVLVSAVNYEGMDYRELSDFTDEVLVNRLATAEGVAQVTPMGAVKTQLDVTISQDKIDEINKKMLKSVDADLAEVQDKLDDAQEKIDSGSSELNSSYSENSSMISQGETAIAEGQAQIDAKKSELDSNQVKINEAKNSLETNLEQINIGIRGIEDAIASIQLQMAIETDQTKLAKLRALLNEYTSQKEVLVGQKAQIESGLKELAGQQALLDQGKAGIDSAQNELDSKKFQLEQSKLALESGISQAKMQLEQVQDTVDEQQGMFNDARDAALEKANIDGIVTVELVSQILAAQNFDMPAGYVDDGGMSTIVKVGDEIESKEELENLLLMNLGLEYVDEIRLSDVADIDYSDDSDEIYAKLDGKNGILFMFTAQSTYSTTEVDDNIKAIMADLQNEYPGLEFVHMMDQGIYIDIVINTVLNNLLMGAIFAIIVLFIFLRSPKPTLIVAVSIPISVIFALALMYFSGMTMNIISLAGLALGIGMLVDNSIVVIENTYRLRALGVPLKRAAYEGAKEMAPAIAASTITTICVFFPIVFTDGLTKQFFSDMALTITYSLLCSLIVALTVVPAMSGSLLRNVKIRPEGTKSGQKILGVYDKVITWSLKYKAVVVVALVAAFVICFWTSYSQGVILLPEMEGDQMTATVTMPDDMIKSEQFENIDEISSRILELNEIESLGVIASGSNTLTALVSSGGGENDYTVYMNLVPERAGKNLDIVKKVQNILSDYNCESTVSSSNMDLSTLTGSQGLTYNIHGDDYDNMMQAARDIAEIISGIEGTESVEDGIGDTNDEIRITIDKDKAMAEGLTVAQVYMDVASQISEGNEATTLHDSGDDMPVVVIDGKSFDINADNVADIHIAKPESAEMTDETGLSFEMEDSENEEEPEEEEEPDYVVLSDIATIERGESPAAIMRNGQQRQISVSGRVDGDHNITLVTNACDEAINNYQCPDGVTIDSKGESESIMIAVKDLAYVLIIAILLIYLIMVIQFQSLKSPFIVMFTIPLAFTGGFLALLIGGFELSTIAIIGMLLLSGVVVNNGIVLVDCINRLRLDGMETKAAIIQAGKTRMRPIFMTALTTILGMLTLTLGMGQGAELIQPMAVTVVGGLAYATILTLVFVPILYHAMNKKPIKRHELEDEEEDR